MKKNILLLALFSVLLSYAQQKHQATPKYPELFKTVPLISDEDPEWVHLLYSDTPNILVIENAYNKYYKSHLFKKTTHTQNYKHFMMMLNSSSYVQENGAVYIPTLEEENIQKNVIRQKFSNQNTQRTVQTANWSALGPLETFYPNGVGYKASQTNIYTLAQSKSNPNILFAGSETGVISKSTDKGLNWLTIAADQDMNARGAIAIDPTNENIVFISDNRNNLYKTTDDGSTWTVSQNLSNSRITAITINGNVILTAGRKGLYRSTDNGTTWTNIISDKCWDLALKPNDANTVFVAKHNATKNRTEIWKSTDNGLTFTPKTTGWWEPVNGVAASDSGARIGVTDADPNRIYVVLLGNEDDATDDANYIGIYRSNNSGDTWSTPYDGNNDSQPDNEPGGPYGSDHWCMSTFNPNSNGGYNQGFYDLGIAVSDTNPDKFLVGFLNLFKSEDGGTTYTEWGGYRCDNCGSGYRHPDIQAIIANGNDVWVCSDGGVDYYNDNLDYQETRIKGLQGVNFWEIDQGWNEDVLVGGRYHNGNTAHYQSYGSGKFLSLGGGESPTGYVNQAKNKEVHFSDIGDKLLPETLTGGVSGVSNYQIYPNQGYYLSQKSEIVTDPIYWNNLYLGKEHKLWKSTDGGASFDLLKAFGTNTDDIVKGIEISRANPDVIYIIQRISGTDKLWKSTDAGISWNQLTLPTSDNQVTISIDEADENTLYISFNKYGNNTNKVFKTTDGGANWVNLTTAILNGERVRMIKTQAGTDGGVYIATNHHIFYKNNTLSDWQLYNSGLPYSISPLKLMPFYRDGKIRFGTFNRGVFESDFYESSQPIAQPMVATKEQYCATRAIQFEDFSILNQQGATWSWNFPGASSISDATIRNPLVTYNTAGTYDVTLTVTNASGVSNTKTIPNMVEVLDSYCDVEANPQMALSCDSASHQYAVNSSINYTNVSDFTFTTWIKPNGIQNNYTAIFSLGSGTGNEKNVLNFRESNNTLGIHLNGGYWSRDSNLIIPENEWSFVAITITPTQVKLFVNEQAVTWNINSNPFNIDKIVLGSYYGWGGRNFNGELEESCFWKRALTDTEIKLARHLIKQNISDPDLIAYYQYNHKINGSVYEKKNGYDLALQGNPTMVTSTAPVGIGVSQLLTVNTTGITDFNTANTTIDFNTNTPNGKIVVSEIANNPNNLPSNSFPIEEKYWIINNYGSNTTFDALNNITFKNIGNISSVMTSDIKLYKRNSNADVQTDWNEVSTATSSDNTTQTASFGGNNITSFSQFYIGSATALEVTNFTTESIKIYPNPVINNGELHLNCNEAINSFVIYDSLGKEVYKKASEFGNITIKNIAQGVYFYKVETASKMYQGKIIVKN